MHLYGYRAYALQYKILKKDKLTPRAHLGYLIRYNSRNIYRIQISSYTRVIRTRDITFDYNSYQSLNDLDIGDVLREDTDQILDTLDLLQANTNNITDDKVLDFIVVDYSLDHVEESSDQERVTLRDTPICNNTPQQLLILEVLLEPTIGPMPTMAPDPESEPTNARFISVQNDLVVLGSHQFTGIDTSNIVTSRRQNAYLITLAYNYELVGYYSAFSTALYMTKKRRPYRDTLLEPSKSYQKIKSYIYTIEFKATYDKEIKTLFDKDMFIYIDKSEVLEGLLPLLLM